MQARRITSLFPRFIGLVAALLCICTLIPAHAAQYTLRLSSWGSPATPQVAVFVDSFTKALTALSKGQIAVQSFPAGALANEQDVPSAVQSRVVDISLSTMGVWASISPPAALLDSVMFRPTDQTFQGLVGNGTPLFKALDQSLRKRGVVLLAVLDNGPPMIISRPPLLQPSDFKGKAIRVYDRASSEIVHTLGAAPSTMPVSDVYPALQRGTVEAAIGGIQGVVGLKEYEVTKYMLDGNGVWGRGVTSYVMNAGALNALPPDLQKDVLTAGAEAEQETNKALWKMFGDGLNQVRQHGVKVTVLEPGTPEYEAFAKALQPLADEQRAHLPADLVKLVIDAQH